MITLDEARAAFKEHCFTCGRCQRGAKRGATYTQVCATARELSRAVEDAMRALLFTNGRA